MTNKDKIQAAHLEAIYQPTYIKEDSSGDRKIEGIDNAATSCTTITAEAIGEYERWKDTLECIDVSSIGVKTYFHKDTQMIYVGGELPELFLNQKAKI